MTKRVFTRAVVTGAGSGLGKAFVDLLAKGGASVVAADLDLGAATVTADANGKKVFPVRCDVSKAQEVMDLAERSEELLGGVPDLVINNAGVAVGGPIGEVPLEDWDWVLGVNLWGVIYGCHAFAPRMKAQKKGAIINIASAAGLLCTPMLGPYNVGKAGVVALSETLAGELRASNVGVSVVCPTFFPTNIAKSARQHGESEKMRSIVEKLMERSKYNAHDIARISLDAARRSELYVVPHADGRWFWRVKRAMPERFGTVVPSVMGLMQRFR